MTPPRSAFGASPPGERRQRPGAAGAAADAWLESAAALPVLDPDRPFERFGAHPLPGGGVRFCVWAPRARSVSVVGDFNSWDGRCHPLQRDATGAWHGVVPAAQVGQRYKFELHGAQGHLLPLKADPFARQAELRPATASVIAPPLPPQPRPCGGRARAGVADATDAPISIYEVHAPSWRRGPGGRCLHWDELAAQLPRYVSGLGFSHVELLPVAEHPFDGSWGYQVLGQYAPSARFGDPAGLHRFVAACHDAGVGVILDWVPAHFPADLHGLAAFDGEPLFEYADPREGRHRDWDTLIYDWRRPEVCDFLVGSALYWLECFGVDGLRVDAVASMLYRDYSRPSGEWLPNVHGGRENLEAVAFLRRLNDAVARHCPGAMLVAEESTAWPGVTAPVARGGLGFAYKWNMGWMHDTLAYCREDPVHRAHHHGRLTFGLSYAFSERYVLALSHDEVVHGKGSLLAKMPGDDWQRFAHLRALYGLMWGHPGKKLLFMGQEFGQPSEWNHDAALPWALLDDRRHRGLSDLVAALNGLLAAEPALHRRDDHPDGFAWRVADDASQSVLAWTRHDGRGRQCLVVANLTPVPRAGYRIGLPEDAPSSWRVALDTDAARFGGSDWLQVNDAPVAGGAPLRATGVAAHGQARSLTLGLPPLAVLFLQPSGDPT